MTSKFMEFVILLFCIVCVICQTQVYATNVSALEEDMISETSHETSEIKTGGFVRTDVCMKWERLRATSQKNISSLVGSVSWHGDERTIYNYGGCNLVHGVSRHLHHCSVQLNKYDSFTQTWSSLSVRDAVPIEGAATTVNTFDNGRSVLLFGGRRKQNGVISFSNTLSKVSVGANGAIMTTYDNKGKAPRAVSDGALSMLSANTVLVLGGFTEAGFSNSAYIGAIHEKEHAIVWVEIVSNLPISNSPIARQGLSLSKLNNYADSFLLIGGTNGIEYFNDVWVVRVDTKLLKINYSKLTMNVESARTVLLQPRAYHSVTQIHEDKFLVFGGCERLHCYSDVHVLDAKKMVWSRIPSSLERSKESLGKDIYGNMVQANVRGPTQRKGTSLVFLPSTKQHGPRVLAIGGCSHTSCGEDDGFLNSVTNSVIQRHVFLVNLDAVCAKSCKNGVYIEETVMGPHGVVSDDEYIGSHCHCTAFSQGKFCETDLQCPYGCSGKGDCIIVKNTNTTASNSTTSITAKSYCQCKPGFWGNSCATPICHNNCNGRGVCKVGPNPLYVSKTPFTFASFTQKLNSTNKKANNLSAMLLSLNDQAKASAKAVWYHSQSHCECRPGYYGKECSLIRDVEGTLQCPNNCSGHGLCDINTGKCRCHASFAGDDCSLQCPNQCSQHGTCTHDGVCQCNNGFAGPDCSIRKCLNDCNNNGSCNQQTGKCDCLKGFGGLSCNIRTDCNNHGKFLNNVCVCNPGWGDAHCSTPIVCESGCSDKGVCLLPMPLTDETNLLNVPIANSDNLNVLDISASITLPKIDPVTKKPIISAPLKGQCRCQPGYRGDKCQFKVCKRSCRNGYCGNDGQCICYPGHHGIDCSISSNCMHNCTSSTHGTCLTNGTCQCNKDWMGVNCGTPKCPNNCNGNGTCNNGQCLCNKGYYGFDCNVQCKNKCNNHGTCIQGKCQCDLGYEGEDCNVQSSCPVNTANKLECSGHGYCFKEKKQCICEPDYTGADCSQVVGVCKPDSCSSHSTCRNGKCYCELGWSGVKCDVANECKNNCNQRGLCLHGRCKCYPGYEGDSCDHYAKDLTCPKNCNGNGFCMHGRCFCESGFGGFDCGKVTGFCATTNCNNNGKCMNDKCFCVNGTSGKHCEIGGCRNCDANNGMCVNNQCRCKAGFSGIDCKNAITCPNNCNSHGACILGKCACIPGFSGTDCSATTSGNILNTMDTNTIAEGTVINMDKIKCNSNGVYRNGQCYCVNGFEGLDCNIKRENTCPNKCGNHGKCVYNTCWCEPGYYGDACEFKKSCDKCVNGVCHLNECVCLPGFTGKGCIARQLDGTIADESTRTDTNFLFNDNTTPRVSTLTSFLGMNNANTLPASLTVSHEYKVKDNKNSLFNVFSQINKPCGSTHQCSQHGLCVAAYKEEPKCVCANGYTGPDCSIAIGSSMWHRCSQNCNNHGTCLLGKCYCDLGFGGMHCSEKIELPCPRNCGGANRGICKLGKCFCLPGFKGKACQQELPCEKYCGAHGICFRDKCVCAAGYEGAYCERSESKLQVTTAQQQLARGSRPAKAEKIKYAEDDADMFTSLMQVNTQDFSSVDVSLTMTPSEVVGASDTGCGKHGQYIASARACFCQTGYAGQHCNIKVEDKHLLQDASTWFAGSRQWLQLKPLFIDTDMSLVVQVFVSLLAGVSCAFLLMQFKQQAVNDKKL